MRTLQPLVVPLGSPCVVFGHWGHINRSANPEALHQSRNTGEQFAEFAAHICNIQLGAGRHLLVENPVGIELFHPKCFDATFNEGKVVTINAPQCAVGLVVGGQPIYKDTILLASSMSFIGQSKGLKCTCSSHGTREGRCGSVSNTEFVHLWPGEMCQRLRIGILLIIRQQRGSHLILAAVGRVDPVKPPMT